MVACCLHSFVSAFNNHSTRRRRTFLILRTKRSFFLKHCVKVYSSMHVGGTSATRVVVAELIFTKIRGLISPDPRKRYRFPLSGSHGLASKSDFFVPLFLYPNLTPPMLFAPPVCVLLKIINSSRPQTDALRARVRYLRLRRMEKK